jgi:hypothetical protein
MILDRRLSPAVTLDPRSSKLDAESSYELSVQYGSPFPPGLATETVGSSLTADESAEHAANLDLPGPSRHDRIPVCEQTQLSLVVSFDYCETPRPCAVEDRTEGDHLARLEVGRPVSGMPTHDVSFPVAHVEGEGRTRRDEPEHECSHGVQAWLDAARAVPAAS